jgi:hypothetical protein
MAGLTPTELFDLTALRRQFPRVEAVLKLCGEAERLSKQLRSTALPTVTAPEAPADNESRSTVINRPRRDRAAYMRAYRARKKRE